MSSSLREDEAVSGTQGTASSLQNHSLWFWIWTWLPVALGVVVISIESTTLFGANYTSGPLRAFFEALFGHVPDERWEHLHHFVRKSGHFFGYGFIGVAWLRAWWRTAPNLSFLADMIFALVGTAIIATCDEWHQAFLPNRGSSPWDVLLDCTGAFTLQLLVYLYMRLARPKKLARTA
jgi:VanZ family protein